DQSHPIVRARSLAQIDARAGRLGDLPSAVLLERAERDLAGAEEDLDEAKADYRDVRYRRSHTADGRERSVSGEGELEVGQAARRVAEATEVWEDCLSYRNELLAERDAAYRPMPRAFGLDG
ncbi:MAG TPA: hypothetical protein VMH35_21360, partial [Streptosporangiaceae bacterium]|nr:hypothetical protein [Streptosporangiaceae bacterium]